MKKVARVGTRCETIRGQIEELEELRPQIEELGIKLCHFAHNRLVSAIIIADVTCFLLVLASCIYFYLDSTKCPITLASMLVFAVIFAATKLGKCRYIIASDFNIDYLNYQIGIYEHLIDEHDQYEKDLEIYRPKFDSLIPTITGELNGSYSIFYDNGWRLRVRICFGDYEDEDYSFNGDDFIELLVRIIKCHCENNADYSTFDKIIRMLEDNL